MRLLIIPYLLLLASIVHCEVDVPLWQLIGEEYSGQYFIQMLTKFISEHVMVDDINILPASKNMFNVTSTSDIVAKGKFVAAMTRNVNCRISLDKWDCANCTLTVPDGIVVRSIDTYPMDTTGYIVTSEKNKAMYVVFRGATSLRNILEYQTSQRLVVHPKIPGARVHEGFLDIFYDVRDIVYDTVSEQIKLHPDYNIEVYGHSVGGGIASLLTVDLFQRLPFNKRKQIFGYTLGQSRLGDRGYAKYIGDQGISIKRYVNEADSFVHEHSLSDGFEHEGDEYWYKSQEPFEFVACPGPYETKSCASSVFFKDLNDHFSYFDTLQRCTPEEHLFLYHGE